MKFTLEQITQIIKEEIASVLSEDMDLDVQIRNIIATEPMDFEDLFGEIYGDDSPGNPAPSPTAVPKLTQELEEALKEMLEDEEIVLDDEDYKLA